MIIIADYEDIIYISCSPPMRNEFKFKCRIRSKKITDEDPTIHHVEASEVFIDAFGDEPISVRNYAHSDIIIEAEGIKCDLNEHDSRLTCGNIK